MGFPEDPIPLYAGIAPGADPADPADWSFTEITTDVREAGGVQIQVGRPDETATVDATRMQMVVDNRSGDYTRVNPLGIWYGQLDKGTPIEARITRIDDSFTRTVASGLGTDTESELTWSTASASFSVNGSAAQCSGLGDNVAVLATLPDAAADDVEVSTVASVSAVATGAAWVHGIVVRHADASNYIRFHTEFHLSGAIQVKIVKQVEGTAFTVVSATTTDLTYSAGTKVRTRVRAVGSVLQMRVWLDGDDEPDDWTITGEETELTSQNTGLFQWRVGGNTNTGLVCTIDDFRVDVIRASTPVPEWPVRWDMSGTNVTTPVTGAGILRRLSQGEAALRSPMYRQITGLSTLAAYWPGEDGSGSTVMSAATAGVGGARASDVTFAAADGPAGSDKLLTFGSSGDVTFTFPPGVSSTGWQWQWTCDLAGADGTERECMAVYTSNGYSWVWLASTTTYRLTVRDSSGTEIYTLGAVNAGAAPGDNLVFRLKASFASGTWTVEPGWYEENAPNLVGWTDTFSGTAGRPVKARAFANTVNSGGYLGHAFLTSGTTESLQTSAVLNAINGYPGEKAGARLDRLAAEEGVNLRIFGDTDDTAPMGVQQAATFLDLVRECEAADQGVLFESGAGLGYLTRGFRENPDVTMALDFDEGHIAAPPEPVDDDQRLRNQIKLARSGGAEVTVQDDSSIAKSGIYADELTVNLQADGQLPDHASWRLHLGTFDDLRWPRIELDLARNPDLIGDWCKVRVGSRITIDNPPDAVAGQDLDLIVEGWTETFGPYSWDVVLACSPAASWRVAVFDDSDVLATSASTTLGADIDADDTSIMFSTANPKDVWSTTNEPYDVLIGGERMTVTAMGAASGSGPYEQTATVTRAVNGIAKSHSSGDAIDLAVPYYAGV